jgi:hypothetical protein
MGKIYGMAFVGVAFAGLMAVGLRVENNDIEKVVTSMKLNDLETSALRQCHSDMSGNYVRFAHSYTYGVPDEICGCQAKSMVKVFKPDNFAEHKKVVDAMVKDQFDAKLEPATLKGGYTPTSATQTLMLSLTACAAAFHRADVEKQQKAMIAAGHPELVNRIR